MGVTFLLAHTCRFSLELLCCDNCRGPIFGSCRYIAYYFDGLELAHTVQFFIANILSDKKVRFFIRLTVGAHDPIFAPIFVYDKKRNVCVEHSIRDRMALL